MSSTSLDLYSSSVVVTSDRCFNRTQTDESGAFVVGKLTQFGFKNVDKILVQDDRQTIADWIVTLSDTPKKAIIITVGGTGLCPRDVTPEATEDVIDRSCPGIANSLLFNSLKSTPFAALSRLKAGIRKSTLIVNFPGKKTACEDCWACLEPLICHSIHQINYDRMCIDAFHSAQETINQQTMNTSKDAIETSRMALNSLERMITLTDPIRSDTIDKNELASSSMFNSFDTNETNTKLSNFKDTSLDIRSPKRYLQKSRVETNKRPNLRESKYPLVDYYTALDILSEKSTSLYQESTTFLIRDYDSAKKLIGETLADTVKTKRMVPAHKVSTMDGYVLNIPPDLPQEFGCEGLVLIEADVLPDIEAFIERQISENNSNSFFCYPVNTGGKIPTQKCIIVPIEKTGPINNGKLSIYEIKKGLYTREPGSDLSMDFSLSSGSVIGPVELSLLCSMGVNQVKVIRKPNISIMSTGDELIQPFATATSDDCVIDTNGPLLTTYFSSRGFTVNNCGIVKDNCDELLTAMREGLSRADILIISGGASMGTKDYVKEVIETDLNGSIHFGRVNMKPGKPVAFATCSYEEKRKFIFCLPGNPVSTFVTSLVLVMPFLRQSIKNSPTRVNLSEPTVLTTDPRKIFDIITAELIDIVDDDKDYYLDDRMEFIRAILICFDLSASKYLVSVSIKQQSSRLLSLRGCDCLLVIPPHINGCKLQIGQIYPALKL